MEEKKLSEVNTGVQSCDAAGSCKGTVVDMHRLCFRHCCMVKCIAVIVVLAAVFLFGLCAGYRGENRHHSRGAYQQGCGMTEYGDEYGYGDAYEGRFPMMGRGGYQDYYGRNMMYRVSGNPTVTVTSLPAEVVPPSGTSAASPR